MTYRFQILSNELSINFPRGTLKKNGTTAPDQWPGRKQDHERDSHTGSRVGKKPVLPGGKGHDRSRNDDAQIVDSIA